MRHWTRISFAAADLALCASEDVDHHPAEWNVTTAAVVRAI